MPRRYRKALFGWCWGLLCVAGMGAAAAEAPDPLIADPSHTHLELQNQWVRVLKEFLGPHETMPVHQHPAPGAVIVFLTDRNNKLMYSDGSVKTFQNHAGEAIWSAPTTHRSENLTNAQFAAIQLEPKPVANARPF